MLLLVVYLALVIAGTVGVYVLGLVVERNAPSASLITFLALYFVVLWASWVVAVRITEPRKSGA